MSSPYIGQISMVGFNFAPRGYALCNGQLMSIAQNTALFSILGTTFGGDGVQTFALPNLQGTAPVEWGSAKSGTQYVLGETSGTESVTILQGQMPLHTHTASASKNNADAGPPTGDVWAQIIDSNGANGLAFTAPGNLTTMAPQAIGLAGGSQPHQNMQPYLVITFLIALEGIYPSRN